MPPLEEARNIGCHSLPLRRAEPLAHHLESRTLMHLQRGPGSPVHRARNEHSRMLRPRRGVIGPLNWVFWAWW